VESLLPRKEQRKSEGQILPQKVNEMDGLKDRTAERREAL